VTAGVLQRLQHRRAGVGVRKVGAGYRQRPGRGDVLFLNIFRRRPYRRSYRGKKSAEGLLIFNPQHHQRGQALFIGDQIFGIDPGAAERFA
jgi:hypothetical protein